jgi:phage anti-repressor protein
VTAKWLKCQKASLKRTLTASYTKGIDYQVSKHLVGKAGRGTASTELILMTADCFKTMCMQSRTPKASEVRAYFLTVEKTLFRYREEIMTAMNKRIGVLERNQQQSSIVAEIKGGVIYIIKASTELDSVFKIGKSFQFAKRIQSHGSALADSVEIVYTYKTNCADKVEKCMKLMLKEKQYRKYKEVYQIDLALLKKVITACDDACLETTFRKRGVSKMKGGYYAVIVRDV